MTADRRHMSWGVALERAGIWAIALIAVWFGTTVRDLTKEVSGLREQLAGVIAETKGETARVDRLEKDVKRVDSDVNEIGDTMQWALTTFYGTKVPKAKRHDN